jgi:hypothetical protein
MDKINAVRTVDGRAAVFLRFGQAGYVVVAAGGGERTIEHSIWMELPLWIPPALKATDLGSGDVPIAVELRRADVAGLNVTRPS